MDELGLYYRYPHYLFYWVLMKKNFSSLDEWKEKIFRSGYGPESPMYWALKMYDEYGQPDGPHS